MGGRINRRSFLKGGAAIGAVTLTAGCGGQSDGSNEETETATSIGNYPVDGDTVTFGFTVPQSGPYAPEGKSELRGYEMAVRDINNGGGWVASSAFSELGGDGLLGKTVDSVTADTATDPEVAVPAAEKLIEEEDVIMFTGGSSSGVAVELHSVAEQNQTIYMDCLTHANATTGADCTKWAFRMMFNAEMSAAALVPVLTSELGTDLEFYQLYADYVWGQNLQSSLQEKLTEEGWTQLESRPTRLGRNDYRRVLKTAAEADPDVLFLNQFGLDGATIVRQAKEVFDDETDIVLPLYDRPMADLAGDAMEGVFGTVVWDATVNTALSVQFKEHFRNELGRIPDGLAYLAYAQTILYASSVARVGTFNPVEVINDLEGREYQSGLGNERMRACDHQAVRPVPVARGTPPSERRSGNYFEVVESVRSMPYGCDEGPAADCELGSIEQ